MNFIRFYFSYIFLFFLLICFQQAFSQKNILSKEITVSFKDVSLKESLCELEDLTGISTAYNERELSNNKFSISFNKELLGDVLDAILKNENLTYKVIGNTVTVYRRVEKQASTLSPAQKSGKKYTISGYVTDVESKETLIGATVYVPKTKQGTATNEYGFYSLTLPEGTYEITFSFVGYGTLIKEVVLSKNIALSPSLTVGNQLKEIIVNPDEARRRHTESKMSSNKLSMAKMKSLPVLMGERDVLKMVQLVPGVQSGTEGNTGLYVRGGGPDQNLILLDGVPVYNVSHLFGFLSTLNGDAIKNAEIYKGGFPARYSGRLSSILDIRMKDGNMENIHGDFSAGLVSGKVNVEGPIQRNKTSFHFSARRTWLDIFTTPIQKNNNKKTVDDEFTVYKFYDLNAKINHRFSDKSRLYFSSYLGNDNLGIKFNSENYDEDSEIKWGNQIFSLRWNYQLSPKLFSNTTLYNSNYYFKQEIESETDFTNEDPTKITFKSSSKIRDYGVKIDFNILPNPNYYIRMGLGGVLQKFTPTVNTITAKLGNEMLTINSEGNVETEAKEFTTYVENDVSLGKRIKLNAGLHFAYFKVENSNYQSLQPRVAVSFLLNDKSSVKFSYAKMTQFLHLLASPGLGLPTDLWVPSNDKVKPEHSTQYAMSYTRSLNNGLELTLEGYHKAMKNLLEYRDGFNVFSNSSEWENKVLAGNGESYGIEFMLEKTTGKTTGWIAYTWAKSNRSFPEINKGKTFSYKYDRRHDISLTLTHKKSEKMDFGLVWVYSSGINYTLGTANYEGIGGGLENLFTDNNYYESFTTVNYVSSRNNYRAPPYHRLDLSVNFHKKKKRGIRTWSFGLYNAYNRKNPFSVDLRRRKNGQLYLEQLSLLPIVPFISYSFKF